MEDGATLKGTSSALSLCCCLCRRDETKNNRLKFIHFFRFHKGYHQHGGPIHFCIWCFCVENSMTWKCINISGILRHDCGIGDHRSWQKRWQKDGILFRCCWGTSRCQPDACVAQCVVFLLGALLEVLNIIYYIYIYHISAKISYRFPTSLSPALLFLLVRLFLSLPKVIDSKTRNRSVNITVERENQLVIFWKCNPNT